MTQAISHNEAKQNSDVDKFYMSDRTATGNGSAVMAGFALNCDGVVDVFDLAEPAKNRLGERP